MKLRICAFVLVGMVGASTVFAQLPSHITLKRAADMGLAMNGQGTSAWSDLDEQLSLRAQQSVAAILPKANNRGREGDIALARACGMVSEAALTKVKRAENLSDYASMMDLFSQADANAPKIRMVAMNRMDGYSRGYEQGAFEAWQLAFRADANLKSKLCSDVAEMVRNKSRP